MMAGEKQGRRYPFDPGTYKIGGIAGLLCGIAACLIRASTLDYGLSNFLINTSEGYAVMAGASTSFFVSLILDIGLSAWTNQIHTETEAVREWQKLRDIDNPLSPWKEQFREDFPLLVGKHRPSFEDINLCFRKAKTTAIVGTIICILLFVLFIPGIMSSRDVLSRDEFTGYMVTLHIWTATMAVIVLVLVPVEEIIRISRQLKKRSSSKLNVKINDSIVFKDNMHSMT